MNLNRWITFQHVFFFTLVVTVLVLPAVNHATANLPPLVSAGADQTVGLFDHAILDGSVTDDGAPRPVTLTTTWRQVNGPGTVTFFDISALDTWSSFSAPGVYELELSADNGEMKASDVVTITVTPSSIIRVPQDKPTIQAGIDSARDRDVVLVSPGHYAENLILSGKTVTLASLFHTAQDPGFIDQTVIDGGGLTTITVDASVGPDTKIMGFTIQNGADGISTSGKLQILHNHFFDNGDAIAYEGGGGICRGNVFKGNKDDAIDLDWATEAIIEKNIIRDNLDDGIEIRLHPYTGPVLNIVIRDNIIARNGEDGIQLIGYAESSDRFILIERNLLDGNAMAGLGLMDNAETVEDFRAASIPERIHVFNNTFVDNDHGLTGGDNLVALNNLFVNSAGIGIKQVDGNSIVAYNLFWNNGIDDQGANIDLATTLFTDPLLDADFQLQGGSPAIDAGFAFFEWQGETVLDLSNSTYRGAAPDLGAYESLFGVENNQVPRVNAGADHTITLSDSAILDGTVSDDGLPTGVVSTAWSQISGPGTAGFGDANAINATASFSVDGTYVLRLTADDGTLSSFDEVIITVNPEVTQLDALEVKVPTTKDAAIERTNGTVSVTSSDLALAIAGDPIKGVGDQTVGAKAVEPQIPSASLPMGFTEVRLATGIDRASSMDIGLDGRILIGERTGNVRIYQNGVLQAAPLITLPVAKEGEFGIHGVALDPNFATNNYFYVYYTVNETIRHNRVSRFEVHDVHAHLEDEFVLVDLDPLINHTQHNGGALNFAADGTLYVTTGENHVNAASRSLDNRLGKVLRYNPDGSIPTDNPFYNTTTGDNRAIWAIGLRNPYTADIDPVTGAFYINDVGAASWEEINEGIAGGDYGWPITEGVAGNPLYKDPIHAYPHGFTGTTDGCGIVGGAFYRPTVTQFPAQYQGDYFFLDICNGWINQYHTTTGNVTNFASGLPASPVYLKVDDSGSLYYLTSNTGTGSLYRIDFPADSPPTVTLDPVGQAVGVGQSVTFSVAAAGSQPFTYQWKRDNIDIPGATSSSYTIPVTTLADDGALITAVVINGFGTDTSAAATLTVINSQAPSVTITSPAPDTTYNAGDTINWTAIGDDNEDGRLHPAAFTFWVDLHHNVHSHSFIPETSEQASGSFQIPIDGETSADVWFRIHVEVVDSHGLVGATFRDVIPNTSDITFQTSPAGLQITLDGQPLVNPSTVQGVVGIERAVGVATAQVSGSEIYEFSSWSDAGAATHTISTPVVNTTYTANFTPRVIDNEDLGYSEPAGIWSDNGAPTGRAGSNSRSSSDPAAEARWTSPFPGGNRDVFFYKVVDPLNSASAEISIVHNAQTDSVFLDLSQGTSGWVKLGRYAFDGLGAEYVGLTNAAGSGFLTADAVSLSNGQVPDNLLTAQWNFNEGSSTLADDSAPEGHSDLATLVGNALWVNNGIEGSAIYLDGDGDYVDLDSSYDINLGTSTEHTISLWFKADDVSINSQNQVIYDEGGAYRGFSIYLFDGKVYLGAWDNSVGWSRTFLSSDQISSGQWHHVALVLDGGPTLESDALTAYLDGEKIASGAGMQMSNHSELQLGQVFGTSRYHKGGGTDPNNYTGALDDVRVYKRALSYSEVVGLHAVPTGEPPPPPAMVSFSPTADTWVDQQNPDQNFGDATELRVDTSPEQVSYLRFEVSGIQGDVLSARLRFEVTNPTWSGGKIFPTETAWDETAMTYNSGQPALIGEVIDTIGRINIGQLVEADVTAAISGDGVYSFAVIPRNPDKAAYYSREGSAETPLLIIEQGMP